jgi:hypothetical protein
MTLGARYIIIVSAAVIIIVAFALSGPVFPLSGEKWITKPRSSPDTTVTGSGFAILVTPVETRARPGDPLDYELSVIPDEGFDEPITLQIEIESDPVFRGSYDMGVLRAPYPGPYKYRAVVPEQAPAPLTVRGTLYAKGGGHTEVVKLVLFIES